MNGIDWSILGIVALLTALGVYWGLIRQVLSLAGLVLGVIIAGRFGADVAEWLSSFTSEQLANVLGFVLVVMLISSVASFVASALRIFAGLLFLGWLDHALGGILGFAQAVLASAALLIVLATFPSSQWSGAVEGSALAGAVLQAGGWLTTFLPPEFREAVQLLLAR